MAEVNGKFERFALVSMSDNENLAPEERAQHVFNLLKEKAPELTDWDLICFSANYLGMISGAFPWLLAPSKHICSLVYTAHYQDKETDIGTGIRSRIEIEEGNAEKLIRFDEQGNIIK